MIKTICYLMWKARDWKIEGEIPSDIKKAVIIAAPHTSNWDFITAMFLLKSKKYTNAKFAIKKEWLRFPLGPIFKSLGAIGIDRSQYEDKIPTTKVLADLFKKEDHLYLMISPEGTRKKRDKWKTGFYYIAQEAGVPIICFKGNYKTKTLHINEKAIYPKSFEPDMKEIKSFFQDCVGHKQENFSLDSRF